MLESGRHAKVRTCAVAESINESYLSRVLRLTLLAPAIIQSILEGHQPAGLELDGLLKPLPLNWAQQHAQLIAEWRIVLAIPSAASADHVTIADEKTAPIECYGTQYRPHRL